MRDRRLIGAVAALVVVLAGPRLGARQERAAVPQPVAHVAFVNVNAITMDAERVSAGFTVLVRGDRIVAVGPSADVSVPAAAVVIDGRGRYLVPGLTDAHVHLTTDMPWAPARQDFGDAPLYLSHGITTVVNLRGSPAQLEWRRRIETGELAGPTIYTSGEFINEPRVVTIEDVRREVEAQARAGYDVIKFHEVWTPDAGFVTTSGLSGDAYQAMNERARELGVPLVGHAPANLDLDAFLAARQPVAHLGALSNLYFLPLSSNIGWLAATALATLALIVLFIADVARVALRRSHAPTPPKASPVRWLAAVQLMATVGFIVCGVLMFPGGPMFDSTLLRIVFTVIALLIASTTLAVIFRTFAIWREPHRAPASPGAAIAGSIASLMLATAAVGFWVPVAWRSSDTGIDRFAARLRAAGISVQTTLVAYDALGGPGRPALTSDPAIGYLRDDLQTRWRRIAGIDGPPGYRYTAFMSKVAGRLRRAGVPLVVGTDAMGLALVAPGSSIHRELALLNAGGLPPYEVMRAAMVTAPAFLGKAREFGTISVGKRADLLLLDGNPLEDLTRLRAPAGVMTRGRWFPRDQLDAMLQTLVRKD